MMFKASYRHHERLLDEVGIVLQHGHTASVHSWTVQEQQIALQSVSTLLVCSSLNIMLQSASMSPALQPRALYNTAIPDAID